MSNELARISLQTPNHSLEQVEDKVFGLTSKIEGRMFVITTEDLDDILRDGLKAYLKRDRMVDWQEQNFLECGFGPTGTEERHMPMSPAQIEASSAKARKEIAKITSKDDRVKRREKHG